MMQHFDDNLGFFPPPRPKPNKLLNNIISTPNLFKFNNQIPKSKHTYNKEAITSQTPPN